jgi:hypothetical protein
MHVLHPPVDIARNHRTVRSSNNHRGQKQPFAIGKIRAKKRVPDSRLLKVFTLFYVVSSRAIPIDNQPAEKSLMICYIEYR